MRAVVAAWRGAISAAGRMSLLLMVIVVTCVGCIVPHGSVMTDVSPLAWFSSEEVAMHNMDTISRRNVRIVVRSNGALDLDSLTLRIAVTSPDTLHYEELFLLRIPQNPKAAAMRREVAIDYRSDVVLADTGIYRFSLTPTRPVDGVEAIGLHIANN